MVSNVPLSITRKYLLMLVNVGQKGMALGAGAVGLGFTAKAYTSSRLDRPYLAGAAACTSTVACTMLSPVGNNAL